MPLSLNPRESSLSDLARPSDRQLRDWESELEGHVHVFPGEIDSFLSVFVPSSDPEVPKPVSQTAFSKYNPKDLKGKDSTRRYGDLLSGLRAAASLLGDKKPRFWRHKQERMPFPFPQFTSNHVRTHPDISVSFPGITCDQPDWQHIALFIYVEADESGDPFGESASEHRTIGLVPYRLGTRPRTMAVNVAVGARGLMAVHGHCAAFGLVIFGRCARVVRFDHSCAVASPAFSLKRDPEHLQKFFWRLFHPHVGRSIVGYDPTVRALTEVERKWLRDSLEAAHQAAPPDLAMCRRVEVGTPSRNGIVPKAYFAVALITLNAHLISPATTVWRAIEDPRVATNDGRLTDLPDANAKITVVILKDAWRQLARRPEQDFFTRIGQAIPEGKRVGLPARAIDCDLGDIEVQRWAHDSGRDLRGTIDVIHRQAPVSLPAPLPLQQTCTWRIIHGPDGVYRERSHVRTVTKTIGRSLVEFKNTRELCQAFRDAIAGHKVLFEHGILHRDISVGNLFIVDDSDHLSHDSVGVLYDFDYSSMVELNTSASDKSKGLVDERNVKERTEMDYFTAVRLLESPDIKHKVWHDIESFL